MTDNWSFQPPSKPLWKALYSFQPSADGEIALDKDQLYEMEQEDQGGWSLVKSSKGGKPGWVPASYLEKAPAAPRAPPPAPAKRAPPAPPVANGSGKASPASKPAAAKGETYSHTM